jgi:hypothetical protein
MADDSYEFPVPAGPLELSSEMMLEMAKGFESQKVIAERYGITGSKFDQMVEWEPFKKELERITARLEAEGFSFKLKAGLMVTDLLDQSYKDAKNPATTPIQRLEINKWLAKMADYEPKAAVAATNGGSFSFQIVIDKTETPKEINVTRVIEQKAEEVGSDE